MSNELSKEKVVDVKKLAKDAAKLPADDPINMLFGKGNDFSNDTGIANFGHGSFAGINVRDLKGNIYNPEEKHSPDERKQNETPAPTDAFHLPLLRYINLPGGSIELKIYNEGWKNEVYTASITTDGKLFKNLCEKVDAKTCLKAITSRAMGWYVPPKEAPAQTALETSMDDASEDNPQTETGSDEGQDQNKGKDESEE